ncbi:class E sortase [Hamadaea tsunoensis]|uniref:class E sortase n=1 Tax=Hamadaea tsunoensis TaxID=53368 RepID=UPI00040F12E4|nr:class E sortase [Hamadaea tsunoensis]
MSRHRASDPNDETSIIPRVGDGPQESRPKPKGRPRPAGAPQAAAPPGAEADEPVHTVAPPATQVPISAPPVAPPGRPPAAPTDETAFIPPVTDAAPSDDSGPESPETSAPASTEFLPLGSARWPDSRPFIPPANPPMIGEPGFAPPSGDNRNATYLPYGVPTAATPPARPAPRPPAAPPVDLDATGVIPRIEDGVPAPVPAPGPVPVVAVPVVAVPPPDIDATATIPRIEADATATLPRVPAEGAEPAWAEPTGLIGKIPDVPAPEPEDAKPRRRDTSGAPIRAVRMKGAYASAYSDYTRVTVGSVVRTSLRTVGEIMITCGLVVLLFAAYEVWGKTAIVDAHQDTLNQQLAQNWDQPSAKPSAPGGKELPPPPGDAIGRLYIPRLNKHWVVVEGVAPDDIRYAPGHYPNSAMPGEEGNFAMAGHRMRSVFWDLDQVEVGDKIVVETRSTWYVYAVVKERIVKPTQVEVVSPTPPGVEPGKLLTLTTCNPKWDNYQRLIIHASLVGQQSRADGPPPELGG